MVDRLFPVRQNAKHDPVKFGLSRYCDEYKELPYGERVRLETSISVTDVKILDILEQVEKLSLKDLEKKVNKEFDLSKLVEKGLLLQEKDKKYSLTRKGREIWETIVIYHGSKLSTNK